MDTNDARVFWDERFAEIELAAELLPKQKALLARCLDFFGDVAGKSVLDVGCGLGSFAIGFARLGANVTAIDLSETGIAKLSGYASGKNLSIDCRVLDARNMDQLGQFDYVFGSFILHHIEPFDGFCDVLYSAMKPGGKAFFRENNAASRMLVWVRENLVGKFGIPKNGDADEFPLTPEEVDMLRRRFNVTQVFSEMFLFRLISMYLLKRRGMSFFEKIDHFAYRNNFLLRYSYRQLLLIEKSR